MAALRLFISRVIVSTKIIEPLRGDDNPVVFIYPGGIPHPAAAG